MPYEQINTIKVARPDTEEGYMIINAADYRADLPQWMYMEGLAYDPAVYPPYVEPVLPAARGGSRQPEAPEAGPRDPVSPEPPAAEAPEHPRAPSRRSEERR